MSAHTKGPWEVEFDGDEAISIIGPRKGCRRKNVPDSWELAKVGTGCFWADKNFKREDIANARLIAAAPELLEACQYVLGCGDASPAQLERLRKAISKATEK